MYFRHVLYEKLAKVEGPDCKRRGHPPLKRGRLSFSQGGENRPDLIICLILRLTAMLLRPLPLRLCAFVPLSLYALVPLRLCAFYAFLLLPPH